MSDFKVKIHQIQFRLGLCPNLAGELTALPDPRVGFNGSTSKGGEKGGSGGSGEVPSIFSADLRPWSTSALFG